MKTFVAYLNEGVKIYFRVSYGICYMLKEQILNCETEVALQRVIIQNPYNFNIISSHQLLRVSYTLVLTEMRKSFLEVQLKNKNEIKVFI